ncbi:MAG: pyridoxal 5'-phosphate synthase glutaminase subunit PdxT [Anaerolineales bacterium]
MKIGVLTLQGDFDEHITVLEKIGVNPVKVRLPEHIHELDGLIIPGGESTTIGKLAQEYGLIQPIRQFGQEKAIWGTCAGAILLSRDANRSQPLLELMDITVERNAFGRQSASFEIHLDIPALEEVDPKNRPYPAIFIRAPLIKSVEGNVEILACLPDGSIVAARQGRLLASAFHPELTDDDRFHRYFLKLAGSQSE